MLNPRIIGFYSGTEADHRGRYLHEIQQWPDDQLEADDDYIQWLFPLPEPSEFNAAAPVLTRKLMQEFRRRPELQQKLRVSFLRMMNFYGLEVRSGEQLTVSRVPNFAAKTTVWLSPGNHNHLRIRRILRCLTLLGLQAEAKAFLDCLADIYKSELHKPVPAISDDTMLYWRGAASHLWLRPAGQIRALAPIALAIPPQSGEGECEFRWWDGLGESTKIVHSHVRTPPRGCCGPQLFPKTPSIFFMICLAPPPQPR